MSLEGDLRELPLASLIEMTALGSKTGLVLLHDHEGPEVGRLVFRDGRLVGTSSVGPLVLPGGGGFALRGAF